MAAEPSFDIVSDYDQQELVNAVDQTKRDVGTRFDLKDTNSVIELEKAAITITTASDFTLKQVRDVLDSKLVKRDLSLKILDPQTVQQASGGRVRQEIKLKKGLSQELAKEISKHVRDAFPKVRPQIQGDAVRVTAKSRDELQAVIQLLRGKDYPVALQYTNYRG